VYNLIFNNDFSETRLLEFIYRNLTLTNILLPTAYVFNAMSVSSDILPSLVWLGMNNHISFLFYILVVSGWLVMYLSSHSDKSFDNKDDNYISEENLKKFIKKNLDISYLYISQQNSELEIEPEHFKFLYALTIFHYFKKSFAENIYNAIEANEIYSEANLKTKFENIKKDLLNLEPEKMVEECRFIFDDQFNHQEKDLFKEEIKNKIEKYITSLYKNIKNNKKINCYYSMIKVLDQFSIDKRTSIIQGINNNEKAKAYFMRHLRTEDNKNSVEIDPKAQKTILKLLLKIEHTYTLNMQRKATYWILSFGVLNAICSGVTMLAGGYAKVGLSAYYLFAFSMSGLCCSYILTSPKIYNIINNIFGHIENYSNSKSNNNQTPSFVFFASAFISTVTAFASGIFAFFVIHNFIISIPSLPFTSYFNILNCIIAVITFFGAFCLYFDSIFTILSNNKKDIYSQEDTLTNIIGNKIENIAQNIFNKEFALNSTILMSSCYILYQIAKVSTNYQIIVCFTGLTLLFIDLYPQTSYKYLPGLISLLISFSISISAIHQLISIFSIGITPTSLFLLVSLGAIQTFSLACTFYKGITKFITKTNSIFKQLKITYQHNLKGRTDSEMSAPVTNVKITPKRIKAKGRRRQSIVNETRQERSKNSNLTNFPSENIHPQTGKDVNNAHVPTWKFWQENAVVARSKHHDASSPGAQHHRYSHEKMK
jgi:hypothetical protein